jgi:hypothetical protein
MQTKKLQDLYGWVNFNYLGLAAGILSIAVTLYNLNNYWEQIKREEK